MRIHILSDIHDDYSRGSSGTYEIPEDLAADAIVIAGDIAGRLSRMGSHWLIRQHLRTGLPIILVAGNHDFWRSSLDAEIGRFRDRLSFPEGIHLLDGDELILAGTRFIGATLWTDYEIYTDAYTAHATALRFMNDLKMIRTDSYRRRLLPWMLAEEHRRHRDTIDSLLATPFDGPTVVITHHAPSGRSLLGGRATEPLDASYASDLEPLIRRHAPDFWIHGHIHQRQDYAVGDTRILCNPRGYRLAEKGRQRAEIEVKNFDPRLIIDTDDTRPLVTGADIDVAIDRPSSFQWPFGQSPDAEA
ncbi:serine/threonine protein phosphatase [Aureimonas glaciei]|uniref:Serine/threonine protein phosphatase n=2 Tax=Aureimonas glaciei TaxID=1776957 RepID=A0A916Y3A2_9HYPH|nr:serine/threonine protein phosphatase [Aureimonas glaciei]